ncbi:hypothetical protein Ahy_B02g057184 [Arachis hypogaea]|uniref:Uncharacterized protein n=1 Tax=Arachis hypogaea TaxID=3818 RepID=A0A445ABJ1_ARAHY|nr:hypothetical protein Ahy_B02g057184 [Arachis hypogaea]
MQQPQFKELEIEVERQISAIRVVRDVDIEQLLMELRLVRSCFSEEQLWKPILQMKGNEEFDVKWKERGSRVSTTCGGVGRDLHATLFQRLSIAFPSEYPSSIPQFGGFEYSSNTDGRELTSITSFFAYAAKSIMTNLIRFLRSHVKLRLSQVKKVFRLLMSVSSQRLSVGMTPKTLRLPKPGEMLLCLWITSWLERQISAIRVCRDVDIERLLMELRLVRMCFSEEQLWKPMLQVFEETLPNLSIVKDEVNGKFDVKVSTTCGGVGRNLHASLFQRLSIAFTSKYSSSIPQFGGFENSSNTGSELKTETHQPQFKELEIEVERQISAIRVVRDVDIERLLMELRLVRSCFSEELLRKPMLQVLEETLPNLSIVKDEGNGKFDVKWKERRSKMSTTCGGVGRNLLAFLFQRLSIAFPSECPSSVPHFGGFEYSSNTGSELKTETHQPQFKELEIEVERQISAIRVVRDVDIERLLMELRLVRSCFSEELLRKPMLQVLEETLPNLSIVKDEGNGKFDVKWKERRSKMSTTCGGVGRNLLAFLFQRLSIAFPSECPSSVPHFGGFEYSSNTGSVLFLRSHVKLKLSQVKKVFRLPMSVSSQHLSVGMTPKTFRLPKPGETLLCPWIISWCL